MKRLIAALLFAAVALTLVSTTSIAGSYRYRQYGSGPIQMPLGYASITTNNDSTWRYLNLTTVAQDTSDALAVPADFCYTGTDSVPVIVTVELSKVGVSGDSVYVALAGNTSGTLFPVEQFSLANLAVAGAVYSGGTRHFPSRTATNGTNVVGTYCFYAGGGGARQWRVIARSVTTTSANAPAMYRVSIFYPVAN
jgi:hypothetical protein